MNREQLIQMAQESPLVIDSNISERIWQFNIARLERFATLVAAHEREECAKVCEEQMGDGECPERAQYCADAIRKKA